MMSDLAATAAASALKSVPIAQILDLEYIVSAQGFQWVFNYRTPNGWRSACKPYNARQWLYFLGEMHHGYDDPIGKMRKGRKRSAPKITRAAPLSNNSI